MISFPGLTYDLTQSYDYAFLITGAVITVSGGMLFSIPCIEAYRRSRGGGGGGDNATVHQTTSRASHSKNQSTNVAVDTPAMKQRGSKSSAGVVKQFEGGRSQPAIAEEELQPLNRERAVTIVEA